jgi:hypothetical protein
MQLYLATGKRKMIIRSQGDGLLDAFGLPIHALFRRRARLRILGQKGSQSPGAEQAGCITHNGNPT